MNGHLELSLTSRQVFYHKMVGDYNRFISERKHGPGWQEAAKRAGDAYAEAMNVASKLKATNVNRLV